MRIIELPEAMADGLLTTLQLKLIKIGARVVRHARAITFQLAEVAVTGAMVRANYLTRLLSICATVRLSGTSAEPKGWQGWSSRGNITI